MFNFDKFSKKELLLQYINSAVHTRTSTVVRWGVDHFCNDAARLARKLCSEGKIRRLSDDEKKAVFGPIAEDVYARIS